MDAHTHTPLAKTNKNLHYFQNQHRSRGTRTALAPEMNPDVDYGPGGGGGGGNGKLRQWLIEQVDCGKYPGLVWENDEKSIFRIPWKHAGKQDYNRDEDAALFKVREPRSLHNKSASKFQKKLF